jgi:argininosuccinate lyase
MKLWEKNNTNTSGETEAFTVGSDREMDMYLAAYDVFVNIAHASMLQKAGFLTADELKKIKRELTIIYEQVQSDKFIIDTGVEDVHSQIEFILTKQLGDTGKKIHTARSRNDQVLTCIKLFLRNEIKNIILDAKGLSELFLEKSDQYKNVLMPGYTHLQVAMPSSFGLWLGAYAEELTNNMQSSYGLYCVINKNPLGSAAGYGSSFPIDRQLTTDLLAFETLHINSITAQLSRGESEKYAALILSFFAHTLSRLAYDMCLYCNQNYNFITLPSAFTTGSSIMPHKKNPDVLELIRAKCNHIQSIPYSINLIANNLPTGYHRDYQILKQLIFPAFNELKSCINMMQLVWKDIKVNEKIVNDDKYKYIFSVEEVNKLVIEGVPFRDAYKKVGEQIESGKYNPSPSVKHTHIGSINNLGNNAIEKQINDTIDLFDFNKIDTAYAKLLAE